MMLLKSMYEGHAVFLVEISNGKQPDVFFRYIFNIIGWIILTSTTGFSYVPHEFGLHKCQWQYDFFLIELALVSISLENCG